MYHQTIKLKENLDLRHAERKAKEILKESYSCDAFSYEDERSKGYIYIICPDVSDLFVVSNYKLRKCEKEEWCWYFRTILHPVI